MDNIRKYCEIIKKAAIKKECWTCECLQGFITQLTLDAGEQDICEVKTFLVDKHTLHSCLGCNPCPPGEEFTKYLKKKGTKNSRF